MCANWCDEKETREERERKEREKENFNRRHRRWRRWRRLLGHFSAPIAKASSPQKAPSLLAMQKGLSTLAHGSNSGSKQALRGEGERGDEKQKAEGRGGCRDRASHAARGLAALSLFLIASCSQLAALMRLLAAPGAQSSSDLSSQQERGSKKRLDAGRAGGARRGNQA